MKQYYSQYSNILRKRDMYTGLGYGGEAYERGHLAETGTCKEDTI
jgi:hypothetical protein